MSFKQILAWYHFTDRYTVLISLLFMMHRFPFFCAPPKSINPRIRLIVESEVRKNSGWLIKPSFHLSWPAMLDKLSATPFLSCVIHPLQKMFFITPVCSCPMETEHLTIFIHTYDCLIIFRVLWHKSCIHKFIQHPCFFFKYIFVVLHSASFVFQIGQSCKGLFLHSSHFTPLRVSFCPLQLSSPHSRRPLNFFWFIKLCSADVRQSWPGVSWGVPLLKSCVSCLDSVRPQQPLSLPLTYPHLCLPYLPATTSLLDLYTHTHSICADDQMICSVGIDERLQVAAQGVYWSDVMLKLN